MPLEVPLNKLDWEDRERVLRLMFSKMNSGQPPSNWRLIDNGGAPTSQGGRGTSGVASSGRGGELNRSFRRDNQNAGYEDEGEEDEDEDGYD